MSELAATVMNLPRRDAQDKLRGRTKYTNDRTRPDMLHAVLLRSGRARQVMRDAGLEIAGTRFFLCVPERLFPYLEALERAVERAPIGGQYCVFGRKPKTAHAILRPPR